MKKRLCAFALTCVFIVTSAFGVLSSSAASGGGALDSVVRGMMYDIFVTHYLDSNDSMPENYIVIYCQYSPDNLVGIFYTDEKSPDRVTMPTKVSFDFGSTNWLGTSHRFSGESCTREVSLSPDLSYMEGYGGGFDILYSTVPIYDADGKDVNPSKSALNPFDVTYSPALYVDMPLEYEYPSKSGGTVKESFKELYITISLSKDYISECVKNAIIKRLDDPDRVFTDDEFEELLTYFEEHSENGKTGIDVSEMVKNKKGMFFISGSSPKSSPSSVLSSSVYTYLSYQKYSILDMESGDINGFTSSAAYANGLYPLFALDFVTDVEDFENITLEDYKNLLENPPVFSFKVHLANISFDDIFPTYFPYLFLGDDLAYNDEMKTTTESFSDYFYNYWNSDIQQQYGNMHYWYYGDEFSFDKYPDFVPFEYNGEYYSLKGDPFSFLGDSAYPPETYQSVDKDGNLSPERTPEEQSKWDNEQKWNENFMTDFSPGSISEIFNGTSTFYQFLTASISVLPSWFLTILASFFVIMLAIVVVKFVV